MCLPGLFGGGAGPSAAARMDPAPVQKSAAPPSVLPDPEKVDDEGAASKIKTKRKALEVQRTQSGKKQFGAIDPSTTPTTPPQGITPPS